MEEIYKDILGCEGMYQASNLGNIKNTKTNRILKPYTKSKYQQINLARLGISCTVHKLVVLAFIGEIEKGSLIIHKDGDIQNNKLSNLEVMTRKELATKELGTKVTIEFNDGITKNFDSMQQTCDSIGCDLVTLSYVLSGKQKGDVFRKRYNIKNIKKSI